MRKRKWRHHQGRMLRESMRTTLAPIAVYEAWADPEQFAGWFVDRAQGQAAPGATVLWCFDDFGLELPVKVIEALPGQRLVFCDETRDSGARVTEITISRDRDETLVELVNSGFPEAAEFDEQFEGCVRGWKIALATLKHFVERQAGRRRSNLLVMRPAAFEYDDLVPLYTTAKGLARWLSDSGELGGLQLKSGGRMTGPVHVRTPPEVLVGWTELNALLTLKAFALGPGRGRAVALQVNAWDLPEAAAVETRRDLDAAIDRLVASLAP